ncbi:MAG: nucleotidyltransferase domain-containing protein [Thermotogae bacterium]|uniref:nucleotidyltransferase domain-containing protein n=1 Tax=Kosmotoga sp. TaxID=1955248 RepID=UPI000F189725|nr:nucleotidyltransferase domain-containing protein [Kosmotoga sp.]MCD6160472.1 nucleotidyltransferase domain-containing protein [Kosmotoga sp.]RKX47243.1 MAG: nucleotidyltransferase domain-containing protein [Thermotogota bacterium]
MPVRSLDSSVMKWPSKKEIIEALKNWSDELFNDSNTLAVGYFGSYARGNYGVGSDLDVITIIKETNTPFEKRGINRGLFAIPVPVDLLIYTIDEWRKMKKEKSHFALKVEDEVVWLFKKADF